MDPQIERYVLQRIVDISTLSKDPDYVEPLIPNDADDINYHYNYFSISGSNYFDIYRKIAKDNNGERWASINDVERIFVDMVYTSSPTHSYVLSKDKSLFIDITSPVINRAHAVREGRNRCYRNSTGKCSIFILIALLSPNV